MDYIQVSIENETSSVITSVSTSVSRSDISLSDRLEAEVTEELSELSSSSSSSCCTGVLQQPWHSHAGPQYISFFRHPQLFDLQPFLQPHPFNNVIRLTMMTLGLNQMLFAYSTVC